jgi:hypothetical protein
MNLTVRVCRICNNKKSPGEFYPGRNECKSCKKKYSRGHHRGKKVGSYVPKPIKAEWVE